MLRSLLINVVELWIAYSVLLWSCQLLLRGQIPSVVVKLSADLTRVVKVSADPWRVHTLWISIACHCSHTWWCSSHSECVRCSPHSPASPLSTTTMNSSYSLYASTPQVMNLNRSNTVTIPSRSSRLYSLTSVAKASKLSTPHQAVSKQVEIVP